MRLRILQIAGGLPRWGGTEKYVLDISSALRDRGHSVTVACPRGSVLAERAVLIGLQTVPFAMRSAYAWNQLPSLLRMMVGNYEVIHAHSPLDYLISGVAARIGRIPALVMTRHMPHPFASRRSAYVCTSILFDRTIAVSNFISRVLIESGARPERIEAVPNGIVPVDPNPHAGNRLRREFGIPKDAILVAAAGRMSPDKGFGVLLRAIRELRAFGTDVHCLVFGDGKILEQLRNLAADLEIASWVHLPGFRTDVHDLWCAADIAVVPSVEPESFSFAAVEALSAGCAVVASRIGALPEVVSPSSGILTEPRDVEELATAIRRLITSTDLRRGLQKAAAERARIFRLDANAENVERVYQGILGSLGASRIQQLC